MLALDDKKNEIRKLWPMGQVQPHSCAYTFPVAAFMLQWQNCIATETIWPPKPKIFTV